MVREYRDSRDRSLLILLDAWLPAKPSEAARQDLELGLSFAATVAIEAARNNSRESRTTLAVLSNTVTIWRGGAGGERVEDLLDSLAELQPGSQRPVSQPCSRPRSMTARSTTDSDPLDPPACHRSRDPAAGNQRSLTIRPRS